MKLWVSPNGVEHALDDLGRCATCGNHRHLEDAIRDAAERTWDENPLILADELGRAIERRINVEDLVELAEAIEETTNGEDGFSIAYGADRADDIVSKILRGPVVAGSTR